MNDKTDTSSKPLPCKQRMRLTDEALAGLPAHTNNPANFQGQSGYWVQGEAVFIPCFNPATAISFYRQRFNAGDIAASHNLATAAVGRMKAAQALAAREDQFQEVLRGLLAECEPDPIRDDLSESALRFRQGINHGRKQQARCIQRAALTLGIDLTAQP